MARKTSYKKRRGTPFVPCIHSTAQPQQPLCNNPSIWSAGTDAAGDSAKVEVLQKLALEGCLYVTLTHHDVLSNDFWQQQEW